MNRQRIKRGLLALTLAALAGTVVAPAAADAGTAAKPGKATPCQAVEKPADKPKLPADKAKALDKAKGKPVGVLVCGDITKINGTRSLTVKTEKGAVVVQVTPDTTVYKGDAKVSRKALKVGAPVAIKAEVAKNGTITAGAILLL